MNAFLKMDEDGAGGLSRSELEKMIIDLGQI
jgi:Ca2+-binding EF-hand superfamily protein